MNRLIAVPFIGVGASIAGVLAVLLVVQVEVVNQRSESYTEREAYTVEVPTPLKYNVVTAKGYRTGLFDVVDKQAIVIKNADTAPGAFQVQCQFIDQRGGVLRDRKTILLAPGEAKGIVCSADTYQADRIKYSYDIIPPNKSITEIRYREVPRTRLVTDSCSMSLMKKLLDGAC